LTIHGILEKRYLDGFWGGLKKEALRIAMNDVDVFHGVGLDILSETSKKLPYINHSNAIRRVVRNGIDTNHFSQEIPDSRTAVTDELGIDSESIIFGFFGRFMEQKGFDTIIEACTKIGKTIAGKPYCIMAVGSGDYFSETKGLVDRQGLSSIVKFLPFRRDVRPLLQGCDCVLMPSRWEAYPLLVGEVLCSGVPLIGTTCIGLHEAAKGSPAKLVSPNSSAELQSAMQAIAADNCSRERFEQYKDEAVARYDIADTVDGTRAMFLEALGHTNERSKNNIVFEDC